MRTCDMPWSKCTTVFDKCVEKICGEELSCYALADAVSVLIQGGDSHFGVCKVHREAQLELCDCVPSKSAKDGATDRLTSFYVAFSPDRLDEQGKVKDVESVWKKWRGREPELFFELTRKYSAEALDVRAWSEAEVARWQANEDLDRLRAEDEAAALRHIEEERAEAAARFGAEQELARQQAEEKLARQKAKREEAARLRRAEEEKTLRRREEVRRLQADKDAAIAEEDFLLAKSLKEQLDAALLSEVMNRKGEL